MQDSQQQRIPYDGEYDLHHQLAEPMPRDRWQDGTDEAIDDEEGRRGAGQHCGRSRQVLRTFAHERDLNKQTDQLLHFGEVRDV